MRLLTKTTLYFLAAMVILIVATGLYLFNRISRELNTQSDRELIIDEDGWIHYLDLQVASGTTLVLRAPDLSIFPVEEPVNEYPVVSDTVDYNQSGTSKIRYRQLTQVVSIQGTPYQVEIRKSQEEKTALVANLTRIMVFVFAGLLVITLIFNWTISKRLWRPFDRSLQKIRNAELSKMEGIHFERTATREFNELNASLNYMTGKMRKDFIGVKEFTENAAHEMQTPLAVIQSKLELLLQDSNLGDDQVQSILQATTALTRLSKLTQSLLLLAKIDNNQFETNEKVSLTQVNRKYLDLFDEFIKEKRLTVETNNVKDFVVTLHPLLADSLISNLLGNAIKYNFDSGKIYLTITESGYDIANTSLLKAIPHEALFKRFTTSKGRGESTNGLGLAIVKKIAETNGLTVNYRFENGITSFSVKKSHSNTEPG